MSYDKLLDYLIKIRDKKTPENIIKPKKRETTFKDSVMVSQPSELIKKSFKEEFDIYKIESMVQPKLNEELLKSNLNFDPLLDVKDVVSCLRHLYYKRNNFKGTNKEKKCLSVRFYIGKSISEYIGSIYGIEKTDFFLTEDKKNKKLNIIIELMDLDYRNDYYFYNHGFVSSYILNKYYSYSIDEMRLIYLVNKEITHSKKNYSDNIPLILFRNIKKYKEDSIPETTNSDDKQCDTCEYEIQCKKDSLKTILKDNDKKATLLMY